MSFSQALTIDVLSALCGKATSGLEVNATLYLAVSTTTPTETGTNVTEPSGNGYARVAMNPADWDDPTAAQPSVLQNAATVAFPQANGGNWGLLTYICIFDAASGGNFLAAGTINGGGLQIDDQDIAEFGAGDAKITLT